MPLISNVKYVPGALYTKWDKQATLDWRQMFPDMEHVKWRAKNDPNYCKAHLFYACDQRNITREPDPVQPSPPTCFPKQVTPAIVDYVQHIIAHWCASRLLSVGRFGSGMGSAFRYSWYSMGSLRSEAPHSSRVEGSGGQGGSPPTQEMPGGLGGTPSRPVRSIISCRYRFGPLFVSARSLLHSTPI